MPSLCFIVYCVLLALLLEISHPLLHPPAATKRQCGVIDSPEADSPCKRDGRSCGQHWRNRNSYQKKPRPHNRPKLSGSPSNAYY
ncbi:hypothetical protein B0T21DRAFT_361557 [Apiosordaria backusii]|uniref:Secreted protein n=1 Tax=Apiosordaria backusii TaxID=314023 RepID=A0AA40END6_9PEZI|nr:hypothetical protein B0T21DRAFT_361557 [Apiosordaria backusii]